MLQVDLSVHFHPDLLQKCNILLISFPPSGSGCPAVKWLQLLHFPLVDQAVPFSGCPALYFIRLLYSFLTGRSVPHIEKTPCDMSQQLHVLDSHTHFMPSLFLFCGTQDIYNSILQCMAFESCLFAISLLLLILLMSILTLHLCDGFLKIKLHIFLFHHDGRWHVKTVAL